MNTPAKSMTFGEGLVFAYRESWAFLIACPLLAAIPMLAEFAQHVGEMHIGMYDGIDSAAAAEDDPLRMGLGVVKTLAMSVSIFWMIRFYHGGRDVQAAHSFPARPVKLFSVVVALQLLLTLLSLFVFTPDDPVGIGFLVFGFILGPLLARFTAAAPLGIWISPLRSIRQLLPRIIFAVGFSVIAMLPVMILHYALNIGAVLVQPEALKWAMHVVDSLVVGWLAALLTAILYVVSVRPGPLEEARPPAKA